MEISNTAVTPNEAPAEEKVIFSDAQQAKVEAIIKDYGGRVASDLRAEVKELKRQLDAAKAQAPITPDLSKDLDLTRAELAALKSEHSQARLDAQLRTAAGDLFIDSDLAVRVMKDSVRVGADGKVTIVDADGNVAMDSEFKPLSLAGLAQRVANEKMYLARGTVKYGAGSIPSQGALPKNQDAALSAMFGKNATREGIGEAHKLANINKAEYHRLRSIARQRGLVA
jgi:hypothetical protein